MLFNSKKANILYNIFSAINTTIMSRLKSRIIEDLTQAMKSKETFRLGTIRLLKAEIMKFEVSGKTKIEAQDVDIVSLVSRMIKQRRESADIFRKGDREEMADREEGEIEVLKDYLPPQLSDEETEKIVRDTIEQLGAKDKSAMGKVMGPIMKKVKGQADGKKVKSIVEELLGPGRK